MTIYASDALRPVIGNAYVPDSMEARGRILPSDPVAPNMRNGLGEKIPMGLASFTWMFDTMTQAEIDYWKTLVGFVSGASAPAYSKTFITSTLPAARLWDTTGALVTYRYAVVDIPTWQEYRNSYYRSVTLVISSLVVL